MLKRIPWWGILKGLIWVTCLTGTVLLMSFIETKKEEVLCKEVRIFIPGADNFIEREEIDAIVEREEGQLIGRPIQQINIHKIEERIQANPYIAFAKVYLEMDGSLQIEIRQRQPVLRIINAGGHDYYIDKEGLKMPISPNFTANVLVATGQILEGYGSRVDTLLTALTKDLYKTALYLKADTLWDAQFEQIYINQKQDMELIPRVGNQRIILGNADFLEEKMDNLLAFYQQAIPLVGWDTYKTINVKYPNQVVCERRYADSTAMKKALQQRVRVVDTTATVSSEINTVIRQMIDDEMKNNSSERKTEVKNQDTRKNN